MIRATRRLAICLLVLSSVLAAPSYAQLAGPAETPPETFRGDQYVDSGGCVFIRTGIDGATRWVPRVNADRAPVCGARPSAATSPVRATVPVIGRMPDPAAPRQIDVAGPLSSAPVAASARVTAPRIAAAPRPGSQARPVAAMPQACGTSGLSARYIPGCAVETTTSTSASTQSAIEVAAPPLFAIERPRRANEQVITRFTAPEGAVRIDGNIPSPDRARGIGGVATPAARGCAPDCGAPNARIATPVPADLIERPRVVVVPAARTTFDVSTPPRGYRPVFEDGRLNPHRGPRTLQGDYQSQAVWTNDAPRRLRGVIYTSR